MVDIDLLVSQNLVTLCVFSGKSGAVGIYFTTVEWKDGLLQCADCGPSFTHVECPLLLCWVLLNLHLVLDILAFKVSKGCALAHKSMTDQELCLVKESQRVLCGQTLVCC